MENIINIEEVEYPYLSQKVKIYTFKNGHKLVLAHKKKHNDKH